MCFFNAYASQRILVYNETNFGLTPFEKYSKNCYFDELPKANLTWPNDGKIVKFMPYTMKPDLGEKNLAKESNLYTPSQKLAHTKLWLTK